MACGEPVPYPFTWPNWYYQPPQQTWTTQTVTAPPQPPSVVVDALSGVRLLSADEVFPDDEDTETESDPVL